MPTPYIECCVKNCYVTEDGWAICPVIDSLWSVGSDRGTWCGAGMFHVKHFLLYFFAFFSDFCILRSNREVQNTAKTPIFCSTNIDTAI